MDFKTIGGYPLFFPPYTNFTSLMNICWLIYRAVWSQYGYHFCACHKLWVRVFFEQSHETRSGPNDSFFSHLNHPNDHNFLGALVRHLCLLGLIFWWDRSFTFRIFSAMRKISLLETFINILWLRDSHQEFVAKVMNGRFRGVFN